MPRAKRGRKASRNNCSFAGCHARWFAGHRFSSNVNSTLLEFVQFGGPTETVLRTFSWEIATLQRLSHRVWR